MVLFLTKIRSGSVLELEKYLDLDTEQNGRL